MILSIYGQVFRNSINLKEDKNNAYVALILTY